MMTVSGAEIVGRRPSGLLAGTGPGLRFLVHAVFGCAGIRIDLLRVVLLLVLHLVTSLISWLRAVFLVAFL